MERSDASRNRPSTRVFDPQVGTGPLSGIIHDHRSEYEEAGALWWQLWKRERELVDAGTLQDYTPSEVAAYLLWERAGRRKTLVTFARHMGVSLRKDAAEEMVERVEG